MTESWAVNKPRRPPFFDDAPPSVRRVSQEQLVDEWNRVLRHADFVVAHNAEFDSAFAASEFARAGVELPDQPWLCTMLLSRHLFPEWYQHTLGNCLAEAGLRQSGAIHAADDESAATAGLFGWLANLMETIQTASARDFIEIAGLVAGVPDHGLWNGRRQRVGAFPDGAPQAAHKVAHRAIAELSASSTVGEIQAAIRGLESGGCPVHKEIRQERGRSWAQYLLRERPSYDTDEYQSDRTELASEVTERPDSSDDAYWDPAPTIDDELGWFEYHSVRDPYFDPNDEEKRYGDTRAHHNPWYFEISGLEEGLKAVLALLPDEVAMRAELDRLWDFWERFTARNLSDIVEVFHGRNLDFEIDRCDPKGIVADSICRRLVAATGFSDGLTFMTQLLKGTPHRTFIRSKSVADAIKAFMAASPVARYHLLLAVARLEASACDYTRVDSSGKWSLSIATSSQYQEIVTPGIWLHEYVDPNQMSDFISHLSNLASIHESLRRSSEAGDAQGWVNGYAEYRSSLAGGDDEPALVVNVLWLVDELIEIYYRKQVNAMREADRLLVEGEETYPSEGQDRIERAMALYGDSILTVLDLIAFRCRVQGAS